LSIKEKHPSTTKLQDQHVTMTPGNTITPSMSTSLILMVVGLQKIVKRILGNPRKKEVRGFSIIEQTSTTKGWGYAKLMSWS
jgi:hypothetical protein